MLRTGSFLVALSFSSIAFAQSSVQVVRVWDVTWQNVETSDGRVTRVPILRWTETKPPKPGSRYTAPANLSEVVHLEERLRLAQRAKDAATIAEILSDQFFETDVNGVGRDRAAAMQFVNRTEAVSLSPRMTARAAENAVVLIGDETDATGNQKRFTHVYVREPAGEWQLLSSTRVPVSR